MISQKLCVTLLFLSAAVGCAKSRSSSAGGQDGGGGHVQMSSAAEVRKSLDFALHLAKESNYQQNVFYNFLGYYNLNSCGHSYCENEKLDLAYKVVVGLSSVEWEQLVMIKAASQGGVGEGETFSGTFERYESVPDDLGQTYLANSYYTDDDHLKLGHLQKLIASSPVLLIDNGDCGHPADNHADASVSAYRAGATICFSVSNLQKVAPQNLLREILGLIIHEAAHLSGFPEQGAKELQAAFVGYYDFRFGSLPIEHVVLTTNDKLSYLEWSLSNEALNFNVDARSWTEDLLRTKILPKDDAPVLAYGLWDFEQTPAWWDPLALMIDFRPSNDKVVWAYIYSILNFVEDSHQWLLEHGAILPQTISERDEKIKVTSLTWNNLKAFDNRALVGYQKIKDNFQVLSTGKGALHCDVPSEDVIKNGYVSYYAEYLMNFESLPDCHE